MKIIGMEMRKTERKGKKRRAKEHHKEESIERRQETRRIEPVMKLAGGRRDRVLR